MIKVGITPAQADEMELWQIACLMGGGDDGGSPVSGDAAAPSSNPASDALLRARTLAAREGREIDVESMVEAYDDATVMGIQSTLTEAANQGGGM